MYNKAILIGRLTADPELRQTPNGISVVSFSLAVDRSYSGKGGERQTDFITCVAWRQTAEFISRYFAKGRLIGIDGSIQTRSYEDKQANKRTAVEIVAERAFFTESKVITQNESKTSLMPKNEGDSNILPDDFQEIDTEDDLPF